MFNDLFGYFIFFVDVYGFNVFDVFWLLELVFIVYECCYCWDECKVCYQDSNNGKWCDYVNLLEYWEFLCQNEVGKGYDVCECICKDCIFSFFKCFCDCFFVVVVFSNVFFEVVDVVS